MRPITEEVDSDIRINKDNNVVTSSSVRQEWTSEDFKEIFIQRKIAKNELLNAKAKIEKQIQEIDAMIEKWDPIYKELLTLEKTRSIGDGKNEMPESEQA